MGFIGKGYGPFLGTRPFVKSRYSECPEHPIQSLRAANKTVCWNLQIHREEHDVNRAIHLRLLLSWNSSKTGSGPLPDLAVSESEKAMTSTC